MPEDPTREALLPGETQLPDVPGFGLHALLGQGCVGTTFRATHLESGRMMALKLLHPHVVALPTTRARLEKLQANLATVDHGSLVRADAFGSLTGTRVRFVTSTWLDGAPLTVALQRETTTIRQIVESFCVLLSALAEAHRHGVLHLGLKPNNVLLAKRSDGGSGVCVCDLGLNRLLKYDANGGELSLRAPEQLRYWSPEQLRGGDLDGRADIFAVGALLYEALTGAPAFGATTREATIAAVCESDPIAPTRRRPERRIPREFEAVCLRALRRPAEDRFRSPLEMSQALRASLEILALRADVPLGPTFTPSPPAAPTTFRATLPGDQLPSRTNLGLGALLLILAACVLYMCAQPPSRPKLPAPPAAAP